MEPNVCENMGDRRTAGGVAAFAPAPQPGVADYRCSRISGRALRSVEANGLSSIND